MDDKKKTKMIVIGAVVATVVYCAGYAAGQQHIIDLFAKSNTSIVRF